MKSSEKKEECAFSSHSEADHPRVDGLVTVGVQAFVS